MAPHVRDRRPTAANTHMRFGGNPLFKKDVAWPFPFQDISPHYGPSCRLPHVWPHCSCFWGPTGDLVNGDSTACRRRGDGDLCTLSVNGMA